MKRKKTSTSEKVKGIPDHLLKDDNDMINRYILHVIRTNTAFRIDGAEIRTDPADVVRIILDDEEVKE